MPRTWVTVLASHPSVSIETLTTHRTCSPSLPGLPTVFITSRSRSSSVRLSASRPGNRARYSDLNSSISSAAICLNSGLIASPDSSCSLSIRIVSGRAFHRPSSTLLNRASWPGTRTVEPSGRVRSHPADVVEDQLRDVRVVADDDEDGRSLVAGPFRFALLPLAIAGFIVAVEAMESPLQLDRELGLAFDRLGSSPLAGKLFPDSRPEVAVGRLLALHRVVGDGNAGNLDDARLDGVDEREVGDDPGEEVPFPVARAAEEERGRRQVVEAPDADLVADGFETRDPDPGFLVPLLGFGAIFALERLGLAVGLAAVAVMGLVVDDDDVPLAAEFPADAVDHLGRGLVEVGAENLLGQLVRLDQLADLEGVEVGDEDLRPAELPDQVGRDEVAEPVVVLGVVGQEHPKPVADRDARGDDRGTCRRTGGPSGRRSCSGRARR